MDRYERWLLRVYAWNAFGGGEAPRAKRPPRALAAWLYDTAPQMGLAEPDVDPELLDLFDMDRGKVDKESWRAFQPLLGKLGRVGGAPPPSTLARRIAWLTGTLKLSKLEADVLALAVRIARPPLGRLARIVGETTTQGEFNALAAATLTRRERRAIEHALRPSRPLRLLGLLEDRGSGDFAIAAAAHRLVRLETTDPERLRAMLLGRARRAEMAWEDFAHLGETASLAERLLEGALETSAAGVNLLFHGPAGAGKTEFARTLAERVKARAIFVGESDQFDGEPSRTERLTALALARELACRAGRTVLVVDEADDLFTGVDEDDAASRQGSKVFMNRLVEGGPAPTIWITNRAHRLGETVLRRMALAVRFPDPGPTVRRRIVERLARRRRLRLPAESLGELGEVRAAPAVMDLAMRAARLARGGAGDVRRCALAVTEAMTGSPVLPPAPAPMPFDPALSNAEQDLATLAERLAGCGERAVSFCLFGPPGTGKSAFARHVAARMGLDVVEHRASDLLSMFVGRTEKNIAAAFAEAAAERAFLILDEADSLLRDRALAQRSWEVTQVNEMLSWMERHPLPFACATNLMESLDPATLRRFVFKVRFEPLTGEQARTIFRRAFALEPPRALDRIAPLAPGDFAVVARKAQLLDERRPEALVAMLAEEAAAKPGVRRRIGF